MVMIIAIAKVKVIEVPTIEEGPEWQPGGGNKWELCNQILLNSSLLFAAHFGSVQFRQIWHRAPSKLAIKRTNSLRLSVTAKKNDSDLKIYYVSVESGSR